MQRRFAKSMENHNSESNSVKKIMKRAVLIIIVLACVFLYAHVDKIRYFYDRSIESNDYIGTGILIDQEITQNFVSEEASLDGIQAKCTVTGIATDVEIQYTLTDLEENKIVAEGTVSGADVKNSKFTKFKFPKLTDCKGKKYSITFKECGSDEFNGIAFYTVQDTREDMELTVRGNATQGTLVARTLTHRFDWETFAVVLIFVAYVTLFMKLLYKLFK